jgi:hypothetical protein
MRKPVVYLIGSLRNPMIPSIANAIDAAGFECFADWFAAGETADDSWRDYEKVRGRTYAQALDGYAARHTFEFDLHHLNRAQMGLLIYPAGKSAHLELGYLIGRGKPGYVLIDNPERWDVMMCFATGVYTKLRDVLLEMRKWGRRR